ncbi:MAG: SGNH/GDSL hydrolase family protein [Planctomycetota bacterium]
MPAAELSEADKTAIANSAPAETIEIWFSQDETTATNITLGDGVTTHPVVDAVPGHLGNFTAVLGRSTANEDRGFKLPDGAWGPQFGQENSSSSGYVGATDTRFEIGTTIRQRKTFLVFYAAMNSEGRPPTNTGPGDNNTNWTFWYGTKTGLGNRWRQSVNSGQKTYIDRFGTFGSDTGSARADWPLDSGWPVYQCAAFRFADSGAGTNNNAVTVFKNGVDTGIGNLSISGEASGSAALAFWWGLAEQGQTFPCQTAWKVVIAVDDAMSDSEIATLTSTVLGYLNGPSAGQIFISGDSICGGFRCEGSRSFGLHIADALGLTPYPMGRAFRVISSNNGVNGLIANAGILSIRQGQSGDGGAEDTDVDTTFLANLDSSAAVRIMFLFIGINDVQRGFGGSNPTISECISSLSAWASFLRSGATSLGSPIKIVAMNMPSSQSLNATQETDRVAFNTQLASVTFYDKLVDISDLDFQENSFNLSDNGLHPSLAGHSQMAARAIPVVRSLLSGGALAGGPLVLQRALRDGAGMA